jgi:hypothetical protein
MNIESTMRKYQRERNAANAGKYKVHDRDSNPKYWQAYLPECNKQLTGKI